MANTNKRLLKATLLLLGSFVFGYNASKVLHELGHAIGYWITGGTVKHLIIHPFGWSYCIPASVSGYPSFTTWAGVLFGTLMGLVLVTVVWRWRGPYVMLAFMTGVVACLHNGFYLIFGCLAKSRGDPTSLISSGTPKVLIIAVGLLMMGVGVILAGMCLRLIGIRSSDGVKSRILVLGRGLLPYLVTTLLYQWLYNAEEIGMWVTKGASITIVLVLFAVLSAITERRVRCLRDGEAKKVTWVSVVIANIGALVILCMIVVFLIPHKPETSTRYILSYYDHESNFAGINLKITHNPTASPGKRYESESVIFWNYQGREGQTEIPILAYSAAICSETLEIVVLTMDGVLVVPIDQGAHRWVFKEEGVFLHGRSGLSNDACKVVVYGSDLNLRKYVLIALDISDGRKTKFEIRESPEQIVFIEDNTAVASVGEDLIKVEFTETGDHKFSVAPGAGKKGEVKGSYKGEFVFHSPTFWTDENADQHVIEWGDVKVSFTDPVPFVLPSKSYIWAIDMKGRVFKVDAEGNKVCVGTYAPDVMIGRGVFGDSLWVAFLDGTVRVFGDSKGTVKIALP